MSLARSEKTHQRDLRSERTRKSQVMASLEENYKSVAVFCIVFFLGVGWVSVGGF